MTIERILEPEVMEALEDALEYDQMDHSVVNAAFVTDMRSQGKLDGEILDLGTGTAQIPVLLCQQCATARVLAVDLSTHMLDLARINVEISNLTDRVMLDRVDAKTLPYEDGRFVAVMSNSLIHHISDPLPVLLEMKRVVARGGLIIVRDLMRPRDEEELQSLAQRYAGNESPRARTLFADSLRAALNLTEVRSLVAQIGFDPDSVRVTSDRHWTWATTVS